MDKGYVWFALNNSSTDYIEFSRELARSIQKFNKHNKVCVITNKKVDEELFDFVKVLHQDDSAEQEWKLNNEYKVFNLTPFTHTIKLEADMLFTQQTDWWWNYLWQHNPLSYVQELYDEVIETVSTGSYFTGTTDVYSGPHYSYSRTNSFINFAKQLTD